MSLTEEYYALRNKKRTTGTPVSSDTSTTKRLKNVPAVLQVDSAAPASASTEETKRTWFKKGYEDGTPLENFLKTGVASASDVGTNLVAGVLNMGEPVIDTALGIGELIGPDFLPSHADFIKKDLYDGKEVAKDLLFQDALTETTGIDPEKHSIFGDKTDSVVQSAGQLAGQGALSLLGVPWWLTTAVVSYGSELESALNQGTTIEQASTSAVITAGADILTEKISGGIKFGGATLDDALTKELAKGISSKFWRTAAKLGLDVVGEGTEEVLAQNISTFGKWLTYQNEENLWKLLFSEEAMEEKIEAFLGGAILGGAGSISQAVQSAGSNTQQPQGGSVTAETEQGGNGREAQEKATTPQSAPQTAPLTRGANDGGAVAQETGTEPTPGTLEWVQELNDLGSGKKAPSTDTADTVKMPSEDTDTPVKEYISMADFSNRESSVFRNVEYGDDATKSTIMHDVHEAMVAEGAVVTVSDTVTDSVEQAYPDLRGVKKKERTPILKNAMNKLKNDLRQFLNGFKNQSFEFEVNGKVLEATLYNTGINEVLAKVTKQKAGMLYSTEEIFRNAQYLYSTPDYDGDPNVYRWNYFYTPVQIGDETVGVRIAVRDIAQGQDNLPESQVYNWGIKKDAPLGGVQPVVSNSSHGASSDASNSSISETAPGVNTVSENSAEETPGTLEHVEGIIALGQGRGNGQQSEVDTGAQTDYDSVNGQGGTGNADTQGKSVYTGRIQRNSQGNTQGQITGSQTDGSTNAGSRSQSRSAAGGNSRTVYTTDSEGRSLTPDQAAELHDTAITDRNGVPLAVYHVTDNMDFTVFEKGDIGFHFGSKNQAANHSKNRHYSKGRTFRVYLNIKNPAYMRHDIMGWTPKGTALYLWSEGILTNEELQEFNSLWKSGDTYNSQSAIRLREILESKGYDGVAYPNDFEGEGYSYIAFHDEQIVKSDITTFGADSTGTPAVEADSSVGAAPAETEQGENGRDGQETSAEAQPGSLEWVQEMNDLGSGKNVSEESTLNSEKSDFDTSSISVDMTDEQRYAALADKTITPVADTNSTNYAEDMVTIKSLPARAKSKVQGTIKKLAEKLGIINKPLRTPDIEIDFLFSNGGLSESLSKQLRYGGSYADFAGAIGNLEQILQNAVLIEQHTDKYAGTSRANRNLERVYVLFGAYQNGTSIIPVQMEIKKSSDVGGRLYVTVAMTKIEADVLGSAVDPSQAHSLIPASKYSLSEIFGKINPADKHFLKYLPDNFLSEEQKEAKQIALQEDAARIEKYKKEKTSSEISSPGSDKEVTADSSVGAAPAGYDTNSHLQYQYGTLPSGENPVRSDDLPVSTNGENRVSQTAVTVKGAEATSDAFADLLTQDVTERNGMTYIPITNNATVQAAIDHITDVGWEAARGEWHANIENRKAGADLTAIGALLLNNAAKAGDKKAWLEILHDYQILGTNTAQGLQALRILKKLAPSDKLYMAKRSIKQMVKDMKLDMEIAIAPELEAEYNNAETDEQRDAVIKKIQKHVAQQLPTTLMEKFKALRYLNMLGNLRTQGRNVVGNLTMMGTRAIHNAVGTGLEVIANKVSGGKVKRTRSLTVNSKQLASGRKDFTDLQEYILDGGKFNDSDASTGFARGVQDQKQIFKFKPLEGYRKVTNLMMKQGDIIFAKEAYARALAGYLKANGITESDFSKVDPAIMDDARLFAAKEAQEATFRDTNWLSGWVSKIGRRKDTPAVGKLLSEGTMPFRKTPANVLVRAEEYSPLGVINSVVLSVKSAQKGSDVTANQVINSWAKTLTGTGLFGLGMLLSNLGLLSGGEDDDEQKEGFEDLNGWQNYALTLPDGTNLTIDSFSPSAIPMLMGAQFMQEIQKDGLQLKDMESALLSIADPMVEMSMLQGVNDTLENIQYAESSLGQIAINAAVSYLTQGLTNTLLGQLERSFEDSRMQTYVDKDSDTSSWLQRALGKASAKIPGWDYNQIPYINAWGEEEETPNEALNLVYNLLSPSYFDKGKDDDLTRELNRLNDAQGEVNVYPSTPEKTVTIDKQDYNLSADEYVAVARLRGQTQKRLVEDIISNSDYSLLSDKDKAKAIAYAYEYARDSACGEVIAEHPGITTKWLAALSEDVADGISRVADGIIRHVATGTTDKYTGLPVSTAAYVTDLLDGLTAEKEGGTVRNIQRIEAITGADDELTAEQQKQVLKDTLPENCYDKFMAVLEMGMDNDDYASTYRIYLDEKDIGGRGTKDRTITSFRRELGVSESVAESLYDIYAGK